MSAASTGEMPSPTPSIEIARTFLEFLDGAPEASFTFLTFDDSEQKREHLTRVLHGTLSGCAGTLAQLNAAGAGVFVTINRTNLRGKKASDVVGLRACFVDKDDSYVPEHLLRTPPSMRIVSSPGKEHAYWLLQPEQDLPDWKPVQKQLIAWFNSDPQIHNLDRVMRLPGFIHRKGTPYLVDQVWYGTPQRFTLEEIRAAYPAVRLATTPAVAAMTGIGRNNTLISIGGRRQALGDLDEVGMLEYLRAENQKFKEPLEDNEVQTIAHSASGYEPAIDHALNAALLASIPEGAAAPERPWGEQLVVDGKNIPKATLGNMMVILERHNLWVDKLRYDTRGLCAVFETRPPWPDSVDPGRPYPRNVDDADAARVATWCGTHLRMATQGATAFEAMVSVAKNHPYDPVVEYLEGLPGWDGVHRLETLFEKYLGAPDNVYTRVVSKRCMIQAVARAMQPGCQADMMPVLEGAQGIRKSTFLRVLFSAGRGFFSDQLPAVDSKDAKAYCHGPWSIEVAELSSFSKTGVAQIKSFLTLRDDRFRGAYERVVETHLRACVFFGTTNPDENGYLKDTTGNRRFFPIVCGAIDIEGLASARDQLWAEALHYYDHPDREEIWWLTASENIFALDEQDQRLEADALEEDIARALEHGAKRADASPFEGGGWGIVPGTTDVSVGEILQHVCLDGGNRDPRLQNRIGRTLKRIGFERYQRREKGVRIWRYHRPTASV